MKKSSGLLLIALMALFVFACSRGADPKGFMKYEMKSVEKAFGDTSLTSKGYAKVKLTYPYITESTNFGLTDVLNTYVIDQIQNAVFREGRYKTPQFLIESFFAEYAKAAQNNPTGHPNFWTLERKVDVTYMNTRIVSFMFFETSYLGGAHPNTNYFFTNYDLVTGAKLQAKDILVDGYETKLLPIAEKEFRKIRNLKPDEDLKKAGFEFPDNKFHLNNNFGFTTDGIVFFYNAYEIAPYAWGHTNLLIPYSEAKDLIKAPFYPADGKK